MAGAGVAADGHVGGSEADGGGEDDEEDGDEAAEGEEEEEEEEDDEEDGALEVLRVDTPRGEKELLQFGAMIVERSLEHLLAPAESPTVSAAEYVSSSVTLEGCPRPSLPEIALIGRSNVGKSSLINALTARKGLALVSKTPGAQLPGLASPPAITDHPTTPARERAPRRAAG